MYASIPPRERSLSLDVLRGLAVFGIVVANVRAFTWVAPPGVVLDRAFASPLDGAALLVTRALFLGKFNALFSFLFGLGFTVQIARMEESSGAAYATYLRRLGALLAIGVAHCVLLWAGDILVVYAWMGLVLLATRRISDRGMWGLAVATLVAAALVPLIDMAQTPPAMRAIAAARQEVEREAAKAIFAHGSFADVTRWRARFLVEMYTHWSAPNGIARIGLEVLSTALLGCLAGRRRLFVGRDPSRRALARTLVATLASGGVAAAVWMMLRTRAPNVASALYDVQRPLLMVAYVCAVALALRHPRARAALTIVAPIGRMPLTSYLAQSLIMTSLFYGYGAGLYAKLGPAAGIAVACAIYVAQLAASAAWLRRFNFGPIEWLWRRATYGAVLRLRNVGGAEDVVNARTATSSPLVEAEPAAAPSGEVDRN